MSAVLVATLVWMALIPARAGADADPASDVLLGLSAFYPYAPAVAVSLQRQLQRELAALARRGLNLKVAIIESPADLGAVAVLFGKPQTYAAFLDREISFTGPQPLLVVMPQGFGVSHAGPPAVLDGLKVDAAGRSDGLTRSAILAVARIARAVGKPLPASATAAGVSSSSGGGSSTGGSSSSGGGTSWAGIGALIALALAGISIVVFRRHRALAARRPSAARAHSRASSRPGRRGKER
jgi:hypothetical protein